MDVVFSDAVKDLMGKRGLKEADVKAVIEAAEASKEKLVSGGRNLAKKVIGELTVYADYGLEGGKAVVNSAYAHRMKILDPVLVGDDTDWTFAKTGAKVKAGHANLTYMGATRSGPALIDAASGDSWFEEYLAANTLAAAEGLFEQKRA